MDFLDRILNYRKSDDTSRCNSSGSTLALNRNVKSSFCLKFGKFYLNIVLNSSTSISTKVPLKCTGVILKLQIWVDASISWSFHRRSAKGSSSVNQYILNIFNILRGKMSHFYIFLDT